MVIDDEREEQVSWTARRVLSERGVSRERERGKRSRKDPSPASIVVITRVGRYLGGWCNAGFLGRPQIRPVLAISALPLLGPSPSFKDLSPPETKSQPRPVYVLLLLALKLLPYPLMT